MGINKRRFGTKTGEERLESQRRPNATMTTLKGTMGIDHVHFHFKRESVFAFGMKQISD